MDQDVGDGSRRPRLVAQGRAGAQPGPDRVGALTAAWNGPHRQPRPLGGAGAHLLQLLGSGRVRWHHHHHTDEPSPV